MQFSVSNAELTQKIAEKLAKALHAGDVILLDGDLGAGKTTFTKGLARGLGIRKNVKSPTFTLIREYHEGRLPLYHMDVYRLEETGGDDLGLEEYFNGDGVSVVEWSQFVEDDLPKDAVRFKLNSKNIYEISNPGFLFKDKSDSFTESLYGLIAKIENVNMAAVKNDFGEESQQYQNLKEKLHKDLVERMKEYLNT